MEMLTLENAKIAIIGLGYVGLPLAVEFGMRRETLGFDIDEGRILDLRSGFDKTLECSEDKLRQSLKLSFTFNEADLESCSVYIVTVPTPIDSANNPNLDPLIKASNIVGRYLSKGDLVIFESTVYPGATEEICVPELEASSGLTFNEDFYCGYSPERINPGDKINTITTIPKVVAGTLPLE